MDCIPRTDCISTTVLRDEPEVVLRTRYTAHQSADERRKWNGPAQNEARLTERWIASRSDVARGKNDYRDRQATRRRPRRFAQAESGRRPAGGPHCPWG